MNNARPATDDVDDDDLDGIGVWVVRDDNGWQLGRLSDDALGSLGDAAREIRDLRSGGAAFALLDVDDEFFVILRPGPSGLRLLLSDVTAALDYDLAADVLEELNIEPPDLDDEELEDTDPWGDGDWAILEDLGLPPGVLEIIVSETDLYADEHLESIAERMGFAERFEQLLDER
ncbi:tRNA adenosine deaminase-associated protein [Dietzia sp.]|uniref:tRNA adenosine deaminase-associated protein n=1 Tax=Dietzia sp. TaxID=1871616 RepID=UPI002FD99DFE